MLFIINIKYILKFYIVILWNIARRETRYREIPKWDPKVRGCRFQGTRRQGESQSTCLKAFLERHVSRQGTRLTGWPVGSTPSPPDRNSNSLQFNYVFFFGSGPRQLDTFYDWQSNPPLFYHALSPRATSLSPPISFI